MTALEPPLTSYNEYWAALIAIPAGMAILESTSAILDMVNAEK
jgi:hypothetical protein